MAPLCFDKFQKASKLRRSVIAIGLVVAVVLAWISQNTIESGFNWLWSSSMQKTHDEYRAYDNITNEYEEISYIDDKGKPHFFVDEKLQPKVFLNDFMGNEKDDIDMHLHTVGSKYDPYTAHYYSKNKTDLWHVTLWGDAWVGLDMEHSGCPEFSRHEGNHPPCPLYPNCRFNTYHNRHRTPVGKSNVVVVNDDHGGVNVAAIKDLPDRIYKVLYIREPSWAYPSQSYQKLFSFQMSYHYQSSILNPIFFRSPDYLLNNTITQLVPVEKRPHFAMSLISDCGTDSKRELYIKKLFQHLGRERVHEYGSCGDGQHKLPYSHGTIHLRDTLARYKFYFAFENSIMPGYVSEKLIRSLSSGLVPVYFGAPDVLNITVKPSFINAKAFSTPGKLAEYLIWLADHPKEYNKYLEWRYDENPWSDEYLRIVDYQMPNKEETKYIKSDSIWAIMRRAACCRLCNEEYVEKLTQEAKKRPTGFEYYFPRWKIHHIRREFGF